jgi:hypothetical protein
VEVGQKHAGSKDHRSTIAPVQESTVRKTEYGNQRRNEYGKNRQNELESRESPSNYASRSWRNQPTVEMPGKNWNGQNDQNRRKNEYSDGNFTCYRCGMLGHMANRCRNAAMNPVVEGRTNTSGEHQEDNRGAAGISDNYNANRITEVIDSNTRNLSEEKYPELIQTSNVRMLRSRFRPEKTDTEEVP